MFVQREPGELFLYGTTTARDPEVFGWVERIDRITLEPVAESGPLPAGGHEWCGSIAVHANGDLYTVNGSHLHRLGPDCRVIAERQLPVDHAHDGLLILADGTIVTKDIRLGDTPSTLTVLSPELDVLQTVTLPEASMGRIASNGPSDSEAMPGPASPEELYVSGATAIHRYRWDGRSLTADTSWQARYRSADRRGLAWDVTVADGYVWFMDNGNIAAVEQRFSQSPMVRETEGGLTNTDAAGWTEPIRLVGVSIADATEVHEIVPFGEQKQGWVIAPPLVHDGVALVWDTANMGLAALDVVEPATPILLWRQPFRASMQPLVFSDTDELVINDFRMFDDGTTSDDLVVLDLRTGMMKGRVPTGSTNLNGMFLTPGWSRDLYYCSTGTVARVNAASF